MNETTKTAGAAPCTLISTMSCHVKLGGKGLMMSIEDVEKYIYILFLLARAK